MATPLQGAIFWNKFDDAATAVNSELGPNGIITGAPGYAAGKFNNGIYNAGNANYVTYPAAYTVLASKRIFDYWWEPDDASGAGPNRRYFRFLNGANDFIETLTVPGSYSFGILAYIGGVKKSFYWYNFAYAAGQLMHVYIEMDGTAGVTHRIKLWIDAVFKTAWVYNSDIAYAFSGPLDVHTGRPGLAQPSASVTDNLKIYDETGVRADILANRNNEGWPVTGGKRMIDGGVRSNLIDGSVMVA